MTLSSAIKRIATALLVTLAFSAVAQEPRQLTVDASIGELLDNPASRVVIEKHFPTLTNSPSIKLMRQQSLRSMQRYSKAVTNEKLAEIDRILASTPGAVANPSTAMAVVAEEDFPSTFALKTIPLWDDKIPGAKGTGEGHIPTLTLIPAAGVQPSGAAVVVAPGGGYRVLAASHEGRMVGDWFAAHGITAFVLRYRLTSDGYQHPVQLQDAQRAIRWVRANAGKYGIDQNRIGMIGFSAGGHLTAMASTLFQQGEPSAADPVERVSSRPDFAVLGYPAILIDEEHARGRSLINDKPDAKTLRELMPPSNVTTNTPPTFIFHTSTDEVVPASHAIAYYSALLNEKVPVEMHIFEQGSHGLGLALSNPSVGEWPNLLRNWLRQHKLINQ